MIAVSNDWKNVQQRFLLPETYIEIDCAITEVGLQEQAVANGTDEAFFSNAKTVSGDNVGYEKYATNELNLWSLDGSVVIAPSSGANAGYVSNIESTGSVTLSFDDVRTTAVPGLVITWSDVFDEYPSVFTITAKNGSTVVSELTVTDNSSVISSVSMNLENYDSITVTVQAWNLPNRRARIEKIIVGHVFMFTKSDLLSFAHEQSGDLLSGTIPKYSIEFTLDNSDGRWNPTNPIGLERYLSERQKLTVRYGMDVNGTIEWIKAGTFYLSEWDTPSNGLEARFVARDVFEFFMATDNTKLPNMSSTQYGTLANIVTWATNTQLPDGASVVMDSSLSKSKGRQYGADGTYAEMVQKCAHASCCIIRYDRNGTLHIEPLNKTLTEYRITQALSYSHPEVKLAKPLKQVVVDYGGTEPYSLNVATSGETQTMVNDYIYTAEAATAVASWVKDILTSRKTISGEFRADPRLDLYDIVTVESKYGVLTPVVITSIRYEFTGSFHGRYTGRVLEVKS